jgi:hypothetical protein
MTRTLLIALAATAVIAGCREAPRRIPGNAAAAAPAPAAPAPAAPATAPPLGSGHAANAGDPQPSAGLDASQQVAIRRALRQSLQPVTLSNCRFERIGSRNDGGYVMCGNLLDGGKSVYSYGIGGNDDWGCSLSRTLKAPTHQYDCFNPPALSCRGGRFVPHNECVAAKADTIDGRMYDSIEHQIARNGDAGKRLIMKIDVEGAEWRSLLATPDAVLERIDQLAMELHGTSEPHFVDVVEKLKQHFYLVHVHFNNWACTPGLSSFPAGAYQVLFVNKRIGTPGPPPAGQPPATAFDAPDNPKAPECATTTSPS